MIRHVFCLVAGLAMASLAFGDAAYANPVTDNNLGTWTDPYTSAFGLAPASATIATEAGQAGVTHDGFGRRITLETTAGGTATSGHYYTVPVTPNSFSGWGRIHAKVTVPSQTTVTFRAHHGVTGAFIANLPTVVSDRAGYNVMADLSGITTAAAPSLRIRVAFTRGTDAIAPAVEELLVTWTPRSLLNASLEAPTARKTNEGIVLRFPVSVSYVNATDYVAYIRVAGLTDNRYNQNAALSFVEATDGGQFNPGPNAITVNGVSVPAQSVYWAAASQTAGRTYAYYATLRSPNGLVNELGYNFEARVSASNATAVTATRSTMVTASPLPALTKTASGTYVIGSLHHAIPGTSVTIRVNPSNWWNVPIPAGAQNMFQTVVVENVSDWFAKGIVTSAADFTIANGGTFVANATTIQGVPVPANSIVWNLGAMGLGQRLDLTYTVAIPANATQGVIINEPSALPALETAFGTGQRLITAPDRNVCNPGAACDTLRTNLRIRIGIDGRGDWGMAKGDQIGGVTGIIGGINDNPDRFVTWGQPINFKISVGSRSASTLRDIVIYDSVPAGTTFASAFMPANVTGQIWYFTGTPPASGNPELFSAVTAASATVDTANWSTAQPANVTWVAYRIEQLSSIHFPIPNVPAATVVDFVLNTPASGPDACAEATVNNTAIVKAYRMTPFGESNAVLLTSANGVLQQADSEPVVIRPVVPNLNLSNASASSSATPGQTATATISVQNTAPAGNPLDTAFNVVATITIPTVEANGVNQRLSLVNFDAGGGTVDLSQLPDRIVVSWPSILPFSGRNVSLTYRLPLGIRNNTTFTTSADIRADDDCGPHRVTKQALTTVTSSPALVVAKDVDYRVARPGFELSYDLTYRNNGTAPSTQTWILDRIANQFELLRVQVPTNGEVWFSNLGPPFDVNAPLTGGLPNDFSSSFPFRDDVIRAKFTRGTNSGGFATAPAGTRWVAILVDNASFATPLFPTGLAQHLTVDVRVRTATPEGSVLANEAATVSNELLLAVGNRVEVIISEDPGLALAKSCDEVRSVGEQVIYTLHFRNDTTNLDDQVIITDIFPVSFVLDTNPFTFSRTPASTTNRVLADGRREYSWTFNNLQPLEEGTITIRGRIANGVPSGTFVTNEVVGIAVNDFGTASIFDSCTTLVENADLAITKLAQNNDPRSSEEVTWFLTVSNENRQLANGVAIRDVLPAGMTFVGGSASVITPGWSLIGTAPANGATTINLRLASAAGNDVLPGLSGPILITYRTRVGAAVLPGTSLTNTATVSTTTGEDNVFPNTATATVKTPLPDPYVTIAGTPLVRPGEAVSWTLTYGNEAREDAFPTVVYFSLPDGPTTPGVADFTLVSVLAPPGGIVYYNGGALGTTPAFNPANPTANGWSTTPSGTVNHVAVFVRHCADPAANCNQGDLDSQLGPFSITVTASARQPDGSLPAAGGSFVACSTIAMVGGLIADGNPNNNGPVCATTRTPGVDMEVATICDPDGAFPGLAPGMTGRFTIAFRNSGTVPAYGIVLRGILDDRFDYEFDDAGAVLLTDASGNEVNPIDNAANRAGTAIQWTAADGIFYLGSTDQASPAFYGRIGLRPGDSGTITVTARVRGSVTDGEVLTNVAELTTVGRPEDEAEEFLANNDDACTVNVYRADVFVVKKVENATTGNHAIADAGDTVRYVIEYGNSGRFEASDVVFTDTLPSGVTLAGPISNLPVGAVAEYDDGSGDWNYNYTGGVDASVRAVRVRYVGDATMPAPATGVFTQTTVDEFNRGTYSGTLGLEEFQAVGVGGGGDTGELRNVIPDNFANVLPPNGLFIGNSPLVSQTAYAREQFSGPLEIKEMAFRPRNVTEGTVTLEKVIVQVALLNPLRRPQGAGSNIELSEVFDDNFASAPVTVFDGSLRWDYTETLDANGVTRAFEYRIPFEKAFRYDPADGDLVVLIRYSGASPQWIVDYTGTPSHYLSKIASVYGINDFGAKTGSLEFQYPLVTEFRGKAVAANTYTSPVFPAADEGNVISWGLAIVNASIGDAPGDGLMIEVYGTNGDGERVLVAEFPAEDGRTTYDLSSVDPAEYTNMQLVGKFEGAGGQCMIDIAAGDESFSGVPTGINEDEVVVGIRAGSGDREARYGAFAWTLDDGFANLHGALPVDPGYAVEIGDGWKFSVPSDINDSGLVAGWAAVAAQELDQDGKPLYVPEACFSEGRDDLLFLSLPYGGAAGASQTLQRNTQIIFDPTSVIDGSTNAPVEKLRINEILLPFEYVEDIYLADAFVYIGYGVDSPTGDFGANWAESPTTIIAGSNLDASFGSLRIPIYSQFVYEAARGRLMVEISYYGGTRRTADDSPTSPPALFFEEDLPNAGTTVLSDSGATGTVRHGVPSTFVFGQYVEAGNGYAPVVWRPVGEGYMGSGDPFERVSDGYVAECLPQPADAHVVTPQYGTWFPRTPLVYINNAGVVASSFGASREFGRYYGDNGNDLYGTAVVWCNPDPARPTHWEARPMYLGETLAPPAIVMDLAENNDAIGVFYSDASGNVRHRAGYARAVPGTGNCPASYVPVDLTESAIAAFNTLDIERKPEAVVPLEIGADGSVLGIVVVDTFYNNPPGVLVRWTPNGQGFTAAMLFGGDDYRLYAPEFLGGDGGEYLAAFQPTNAESGAGQYALTRNEFDGLGTVYRTEGNAVVPVQALDGQPAIITGANVGTIGGVGVDLAAQAYAAFIVRDDVLIDLGKVPGDQRYLYAPTFPTRDGGVAGFYQTNPQGEIGQIRTFYWRPCGTEDVLLEDWTVQYQTDRNPRWTFDVTLGDACQTSVENTATVNTTTPEISTSNNTSSATIGVNTADVAVAVTVDRAVAQVGDTLVYTYTSINNGPGLARNIRYTTTVPANCEIVELRTNIDDIGLDYTSENGSVPNEFITVVAALPVGVEIKSVVACTIIAGAPNTTLAASLTGVSPTIDCQTGNNDDAAITVIGEYPNLWVTLAGPTDLAPGVPGTYVVTVGNDGNQTAAGTVSVSFPAGVAVCPLTADFAPNSVTCTPGANGDTVTILVHDGETASGSIDPGDGYSFEIPVEIDGCALVGDSFGVLAEVITLANETSIADNSAAVSTFVTPTEALVIAEATVSHAIAEIGQEVVYTVAAMNPGSQSALNPSLVVTLPSGVTLVAGSALPTATVAGSTLTFAIGGATGTTRNLRAAEVAEVSFRVRVTGPISGSPTVAATADNACPYSAPMPVPTLRATDGGLIATLSPATDMVCPGENGIVTWTLTVSNTSPSATSGGSVAVVIPAGQTYVAGSITGAGADAASAPNLFWAVSIEGHGVRQFTFQTTFAPQHDEGYAHITATSGAQPIGTGSILVDCTPRTSLLKSWGLACGVVGQTFDVILAWRNGSGRLLEGVVVADVIPAGLTLVEAGNGGNYNATTRTVSFPIGQVTPNGGGAVTYTVTIDTSATGGLLYGDPAVNRAVLRAANGPSAVSNQVAGAVANCDDGNDCTIDSCSAATGCANRAIPRGELCEGGYCNGSETAPACLECLVAGHCNDDNECTTDTCSAAGTCANPSLPAATECTGGVCTGAASDPLCVECLSDAQCGGDRPFCDTGANVCVECLSATDCNDGNACTADVCNNGTCANPPEAFGTACDDGDACSDTSTCNGQGACIGRRYITCNDNNPCTNDLCDPTRGCYAENLADGTVCDDGNACSLEDTCADGVCGGVAKACAEPDVCQFDGVCNPSTGLCDYEPRPGDVPVPVRLRTIGTLGGENSYGHDVNGFGVVVGASQTATGQLHAFIWTEVDGMLDIIPTAASAEALRVTDSGLVLGIETPADGEGEPSLFTWVPGGEVVTLATGENPLYVGPTETGLVAGVVGDRAFVSVDGRSAGAEIVAPDGGSGVMPNAASGGWVAGSFRTAAGDTRAFRWSAATGFQDVTALATGEALDINSNGIAVGWSSNDGNRQAYAFASGTTAAVALGGLGGRESWATHINDAGLIVGTAMTAGGRERAFRATDTGVVELGNLGGDSHVTHLTEGGLIVGRSATLVGATVAVAWSAPTFALTEIGALGSTDVSPTDVNEAGYITGVYGLPASVRGFIAGPGRPSEDLGGLSTNAVAIASNGVVTGFTTGANGLTLAFITNAPVTACRVCDDDNTAPVIVCPAVRTNVECDGGNATVTLGNASVSDDCGGEVRVTNDAPETFPVGATVVTWTATDNAGNSASCSVTVVVGDTIPPVLACPETRIVDAEEGVCGASIVLEATAEDDCDSEGVTIVTPAGPIAQAMSFGPGETRVVITAIDRAGNTATCETLVTVNTESGLSVVCEAELTVDAPPEFCGYPDALTAEVVDACVAQGTIESDVEFFQVGVTDVVFAAENAAGESDTCTTRLTVRDVTAPTIDCGVPNPLPMLPAVFSPVVDDACTATVTLADARCAIRGDDGALTEVADGCDVKLEGNRAVVVNSAPVYVDGVAVNPEAIVIVWEVTATDPSGNSASVTCEGGLDLSNRDRDGDGIIDTEDNCPDTWNADQLDNDLDGIGDVCDETPYDGLVAQGSGCAGGESGSFAWLALAGLGLLALRRRAVRVAR